MAVSFVGVSNGNSAGGTATSFATTLPAGWGQDDVAVLTGHVRGASLTMATPAGWTLVPGPTWPVAQSSNSRAYAWYRVLQSGDTAPTITNSGAMTGGWSMTAYRGGNTSSPIGQVGTSVVSGTSLALPTLVGVLAGSDLAVGVHGGVSTGAIPTNITPDAAYTEAVDHATSRPTSAANQRMEAAYRLISTGGTYGGETFTSDVTASMIAVLVEVLAGSTTVTGTLTGTLPSLTADLAGAVEVSGAAAGTLPALTAGLAGSLGVSAALAGTLPSLAADLAGSVATSTVSAALTATLPALTADLAGELTTSGTATGTLPPLAAGLSGQATAAGLLAGVFPPLAAQFTAAPAGQTVKANSTATVAGPTSTPTATAAAGSVSTLTARRTSTSEVTHG